jgi:hypothetical protein
VLPLFVTPAEMIDVAETELLSERAAASAPRACRAAKTRPTTINDNPAMQA